MSVEGRKRLVKRIAKKARALLRSGEYTKVQVAEELEVSRHTLWRAFSLRNGQMIKQVYEIDGEDFASLDEFYDEISKKAHSEHYVGRNLDVFEAT